MVFGSLAVRLSSVRGIVFLAVLFLMALLFLVLTMGRYVNSYDEGLVLYGATRVMEGAVPHRDFYAIYGPGQFYVLAALFKIFGVSVLVERIYDTVVRGAIALLVLIIVNVVAPRAQALLAGAVSLAYLAFAQAYGTAVYSSLATVLASAAFLSAALARPVSGPGLFAAGTCSGLAMLMRYDIGGAIFGVECAILGVHSWCERTDTRHFARNVIRSLAWFGLGYAVVVLPVTAAFMILGVFPDLISQFAVYTPAYVKLRTLPFPGLARLWVEPAEWFAYLPIFVCLVAVQTIFIMVRHERMTAVGQEHPGAPPTVSARLKYMLLILIALTLVLFAKGVVRVSMQMALVATLALAGALAQPISGRGTIGRALTAAAVLGSLLLGASCLRPEAYRALNNIAWAIDPASWMLPPGGKPPDGGSCRLPAEFARLACFRVPQETFETIEYVHQRTAPGDPVFVGLSRHDRVYANDILMYFALDRRSATRWYQFDSGLTTLAPLQQVIVEELLRVKPRLIVLESTWENEREPNLSSVSSGVTLLDDYIRQAFEPVATFGQNTVLRARLAEQP
jgi:hypothetical protein